MNTFVGVSHVLISGESCLRVWAKIEAWSASLLPSQVVLFDISMNCTEGGEVRGIFIQSRSQIYISDLNPMVELAYASHRLILWPIASVKGA
jgi:hypothetical protein